MAERSRGVYLVTGGAGFIGAALSGGLADRCDRVVAFDNLHPQVHPADERPPALDERVELVRGDVTAAADWDRLLADIHPDVVIHLAAETGTAQSLTEATRHASVNVTGTTQMLDALVRHNALPERVVLASSRAVYGEGIWADRHGLASYPGQRTAKMLQAAQWDFPDLRSVPDQAERTMPMPTSVYGATKLAQEHLLRVWGGSEGVDTTVLRFQNVYGPGQSLTNPHTGVVSFFAQVAKAGSAIPVYEDGEVVRDFVFIDDAISALMHGLSFDGSGDQVFDVGSGRATTILGVAEILAERYGAPPPRVTGEFRHGDVRSASCDIAAASEALSWAPAVDLEDGLLRFCDWLDGQLP